MKKTIITATTLITLLGIAACTENALTEDMQVLGNDADIKEIYVTGNDFQYEGETRSSVTIGENGASFTWDEDDIIGIFPDKGDQVSFAMDEGAGTQTATFSGGGWALKSSAKYAAYYPHVYENRDMTKIPVSYVGQTQNGNANTDHIGAYDFMAAGVSTPENGAVAFDMQHLGALVQLTVAIPEPSILNKLVLNSSIKFTETGTIDLTTENQSIISETQSNTLDIIIKDITTTKANESITIYFMIAPTDFRNSELEASIYFEDGTVFEFEITGKKIEAGRAYRFSIGTEDVTPNEKVSIPNNQVWVTTTDGTFSIKGNAFGAEIVSINEVDGICILTFDRDITTIGKYAFSSSKTLKSIILPNSVTEIQDYAFYNCASIENVTIGNGVTELGTGIFMDCSSLKSIEMPDQLKKIGDSAFMRCTTLECITLPNSVTEIKDFAFNECSGLMNVTLGSGLRSVGGYTFSGCTGELFVNSDITGHWFNGAKFAKVIMGDNVVNIGNDAFNCLAFKDIIWGKNVETIGKRAFNSCTQISNIMIPESVKSIDENAFSYCTGLETVTISDSVIMIGDNAFKSCTNLTNIEIGCNVTSIGNYAFEGCNISDLEIPSNVKTIGERAFQGCSNLKRAIICNTIQVTDNTATSIGGWAFLGCTSLENVTIGGAVAIIGGSAFYGCNSIENVTICNGVTTIQASAFRGCNKIESITIPESVTSIENEAFYFCESLASIYCKPEIPPTLGKLAFTFNASGRKIYVPSNSVETYKAADYWSNYSSSIEGYDF